MTVTVHIDISTPKGRKILHELEKNKEIVIIDDPMDEVNGLPVEEVQDRVWDKLSDRYGVDLRKL